MEPVLSPQDSVYMHHLDKVRSFVDDRLIKDILGKEIALRPRAKVLYYVFKADRLVDLIMLSTSQDQRQKRIKEADAAFSHAQSAATKLVGPYDPLTIQVVLHRALMLGEVAKKLESAWNVVETAYQEYEMKVDKTDEKQVSMLHMLRTYMAHLDSRTYEVEGKNLLEEPRTASAASSQELPAKGGNGRVRRAPANDPAFPPKVQLMKELFQAASYVPLVLEQLAHAPEIEHAARAVFNCYVKGNFAPAETRAGEVVKLNGKSMSLGDYLLEGPYMKWDGFRSLCHDFHICPRSDGKGPRAERPSEDFIFTRKSDLAAIFASTSGGAGTRPVLTTAELLQKRASRASISKGPGVETSAPAYGPDKELWDRVAAVAKGLADIPSSDGLNFHQFLDCLARCALVAFSSNPKFNYAEMYPTNQDKVQALFTTHMSLLDTRHWRNACRMHTLLSSSFDMKDLASMYAAGGGGEDNVAINSGGT